jgi:hypothetical protein
MQLNMEGALASLARNYLLLSPIRRGACRSRVLKLRALLPSGQAFG